MNGQQYLEVIQKYLPGFTDRELLEITEDIIQDSDPDYYILEGISLGRIAAYLKEELMDEYPDMDEILWEKKFQFQFPIPVSTLKALDDAGMLNLEGIVVSSISDKHQIDFDPRDRIVWLDEIQINY